MDTFKIKTKCRKMTEKVGDMDLVFFQMGNIFTAYTAPGLQGEQFSCIYEAALWIQL